MNIVPNDLFFSKEAAEYLGISAQRLNKLTNDGTIKAFKKSSSGTLYLRSELDKRKEALSIFNDRSRSNAKRADGMFRINSPVRQEALNFSAVMISAGIYEKKLSLLFNQAALEFDISQPIPDALDIWARFFGLKSSDLLSNYEYAKHEFSMLRENDEIIKLGDTEYPELLAATAEAPRFLYLRGDFSLLHDTRTIALVGSRHASESGMNNTRRVAVTLGHNGIIIVSGLAKGIDVTAHRTALENNFKTIAVIGTNLNQYYPSENAEIQKEIERKGLVISQFSPALKTERWFFPLRNGVMSGLSRATVIMEAGETSGALKQAEFATKQGRLVLIPQNAFLDPRISWPRKLIEKGAIIVKTPKDIIRTLSEKIASGIYYDTQLDLLANIKDDDMYVAEDSGIYETDKP